MHLLRYLSACCVSLTLALSAMQAPTLKPISQRGLTDALKIGGLNTNELIRKIRDRGVAFAVTPEVEDELRRAGATPDVISAARANYRGAPITPAKSPVTVESSAPVVRTPVQNPVKHVSNAITKPGIYVKKGGQWVEMSAEVVNWKKGSIIHKFGVLGKGEATGIVPGSHSPNSYKAPLQFFLLTPEGVSITHYALVVMHDKKDDREFKVDASRTSGHDMVPFSPNKLADRNFQIEFSQSAGDYGFLVPDSSGGEGSEAHHGKMYTFRITE